MGTIFALIYAMLSMGYFELTFYWVWINEFSEMLGLFIFENWCKFLDDCKTTLYKTKIDPNRLLEILNSINHSIKFTMETSDKEVPFKIWMDIYFKPRDTCRCLAFLSSHLNHCKKNIPFTLAWRICTIVENQQQKLRHLSEVKEKLKKYDYPINIITNGIKKALEISQCELRKPKEKQMKFYHLFLHLIQITHLYIMQLRILLKSLGEIVFQDFKVSNLLTVSDNLLVFRNCWLKQNLAMKK